MSTNTYVTQDQLLSTSYAMIAVTSVFAVARVAITVVRPKALAMEDYLVYLAFAFYIAMASMYIAITPALFRLAEVTSGKMAPYPALMDDALLITKIFFANTMLFWFVLWSVKFSLLALYKRLMDGLHNVYVKIWWGVLGFCIVTLIGCIVSNFTSCHSMHAWFTPGECTEERDVHAQIGSLYYAFAVDVVSDLMIMFLPMRLIWNLQMPRAQKISVGALFCTALICILFATIRVVSIGQKAGNNSTPSSTWLALWAIVEASIAFIIGCCPGFAALYHKARGTQKGSSYAAQGYMKQPSGGTQSNDVPLKNMVSSSTRSVAGNGTYWNDASSSQEELAGKASSIGGIVVTRTIDQNVGPQSQRTNK